MDNFGQHGRAAIPALNLRLFLVEQFWDPGLDLVCQGDLLEGDCFQMFKFACNLECLCVTGSLGICRWHMPTLGYPAIGWVSAWKHHGLSLKAVSMVGEAYLPHRLGDAA